MKLQIRPMQPQDSAALHQLFHAAVHRSAIAFYTAAQCAAWAPAERDMHRWQQYLLQARPWVAWCGQQPAGFADLQPDGLIGLFFVHPDHGRRGVGHALMQHLFAQAQAQSLSRLRAEVSLAAEAFFARHGFVVQQRQQVAIGGQRLDNARMQRILS